MSDKKLFSIPTSIINSSPIGDTFVVKPDDLYTAAADPKLYIEGKIETTFQIHECYLREYREHEAELREYFRERIAAELDKMVMNVLGG